MGASYKATVQQNGSLAAESLGGNVELRYVARAGLLPELSRQTYDKFYKALREAVLNAIDAEATRIDLDFSQIVTRGELIVSDDGVGMSTREFCEQFMSLGGSVKFGEASRFGRIGIGSLALLQYGETAIVETKRAGSAIATRARIHHPWSMGRQERRRDLGELSAGVAEEYVYEGPARDHFTRLRLLNVNGEVAGAGQDPADFYRLLEDLRRVLPLPWKESRLTEELRVSAPELVEALERHVGAWCSSVFAHAPWERDIELHRRLYGDDHGHGEDWSGPPYPILKTLRVPSSSPRREILIAGFLLNQKRASATWSGITARVQNVAVEERTFFDVTSDPGFRKYITGEVWILGDLHRERLINIDRSSFNRECIDYRVVQRYMSRAVLDFKASNVQRPQRQKVELRRRLEQHVATLRAVEKVASAVTDGSAGGARGLPSSEPSRGRAGQRHSIVDALESLGAQVIVLENEIVHARVPYELSVAPDGRIVVTLDADLVAPRVRAGDVEYRVSFAEGRADDAPVLVRNRPREIIFNTNHPVHCGRYAHTRYQLSLALELVYLLGDFSDPADVYYRMLGFMELD